MEKQSANAAIRRRSQQLSAMAAGGTTHEKAVAAEKLQRLAAKYNFTEPDASEGEDAETIFSDFFKRLRRKALGNLQLPAARRFVVGGNFPTCGGVPW